MADVEGVRLNLNDVEMRQSSVRQTPNTSFGSQFQSGLSSTARVVGGTTSAAGYAIPGASVVGAAITSLGNVRDTSSTSFATANASGLVSNAGTAGTALGGTSAATLSSSGSSALGATGTSATGTDASSQLLAATQQMQEMNQTFNLQYLQLQEKMQAENREFTAMSNVMKAKSDTAKNSLSNLK